MRFSKIFVIFLIFVLASCAGSKTVSKHQEQMATAPSWVKNRPISNMYYIGIAKLNKSNYSDNYVESAKKIALNDLASEISVKIQSNSLVSSYEDNAGFKSEFSRYIQMEMTKDLSGYQLQATFETDEMYMVYYRLSKSKWKEIQAERKKAAADRSNTLFQQALKEKAELNYISSINTSISALLEIKKYWNESVYYQSNGQTERLDMDIRKSVISTLSEIQLKYTPEQLKLNIDNDFKTNLHVSVENKAGEKLSGFPIHISYRKASMPYQNTVNSTNKDEIIKISNVQYKQNDLFLELELEKENVLNIKSEDKKLLNFMNEAFRSNSIEIPISFELPKIFISSDKEDSPYYHYIKDAIQQALGKSDFIITNSKENAGVLFNISIHESNANTTTRLMSSFLSYSIEIKDKADKTIYTFTSEKYKGVDYSIEAAKEKSYIQAAEEIDVSIFNRILKAIIK